MVQQGVMDPLVQRIVQRFSGDVIPLQRKPGVPTVKIDGETYNLSTDAGPLMDALGDEEEVPGGARLIKLPSGNKWKYLWVYDTERKMVAMWRATDGNEKVYGRANQMSAKIVQLDRKGQINRVDNKTFRRIERFMRKLADKVLKSLQDSIEENKDDWTREIEVQVRYYFDKFIRRDLERAIDNVRRGVFPFDFKVDPSMSDLWTPERQAISHIMAKLTGRGSEFSYDKVWKYLTDQGLDVENQPQEIDWAIKDVVDEMWNEIAPREKYAMGALFDHLRKENKTASDMTLRVAAEHIGSQPLSDFWVDQKMMAEICPKCAEKMASNSIRCVRASLVFGSDLVTVEAGKWNKLPKGWTDESVKKFWGKLTGDNKHKVTACIKKMEGKIDDPGAFCASLADKVEGSAWRHEPRKKTDK